MGIALFSLIGSMKLSLNRFRIVTHAACISIAILLNSMPQSALQLLNGNITIGIDWLVLDFVVTALIFTPLEIFTPLKTSQSKLHADWKTDLTYFVVFDLSVKFIIIAIRFPAEYFFTNTAFNQLHRTIQSISYFPQLILALFIADLFQYLRHSTAIESHFYGNSIAFTIHQKT